MGSTEIINRTTQALKVKVGNNRIYTEIATVEKDAVYKVFVDSNATYHEFCMGVDAAGKPILVDSDDCVDNQYITITEKDGKFDLDKVPRQIQQQAPRVFKHTSARSITAAKRQPRSSWTLWK